MLIKTLLIGVISKKLKIFSSLYCKFFSVVYRKNSFVSKLMVRQARKRFATTWKILKSHILGKTVNQVYKSNHKTILKSNDFRFIKVIQWISEDMRFRNFPTRCKFLTTFLKNHFSEVKTIWVQFFIIFVSREIILQ